MQQINGQENSFLIILHGGAGPQDPTEKGITKANKALEKIAKEAIKMLKNDVSLQKVACFCLRQLEDDVQFNAGIGSALQSDGLPRLSAALMNGNRQSFSGVISATYMPYPSLLLEPLQKRRAKVLTAPGTELMARELNIPVHSNLTQKRSRRWIQQLDELNYPSNYNSCDTVGVIIKDPRGRLVAASSTGGRGHEYPGRVSDSGTVAGNYASKHCAIAVTGHGEQITDDGVAVRIETRVRDGMTLKAATIKTFLEALKSKRRYGWICATKKGEWNISHTTKFMPFVVYGANGLLSKFDFEKAQPNKSTNQE